MSQPAALSGDCGTTPTAGGPEQLLGSTTARIWTPPLVTGPPGPCGCGCALTPQTSYGFDLADFAADIVGTPLDPWQRWAGIHLGEMLPDGRPRFRKIVLIVARQNGKSYLGVMLTLFWQFIERQPLILGTNSKIEYAREAWQKAVVLAKSTPVLADLLPRTRQQGIRNTNGEQEMATREGSRYKISAANEEGGRSLTLNRVLLDELRQHHNYQAWAAVVPAANAVRDAQIVAITNKGTSQSVVLNELREAARTYIETGQGDRRLGLLEWSVPDEVDPAAAAADPAMLALANPNLGRRLEVEDLLADGRTAAAAGGEALQTHLTEVLCLTADNPDDTPITRQAWDNCRDDEASLADLRARLVVALDVAPDGEHVTLAGAAMMTNESAPDEPGPIVVEIIAAWRGETATEQARLQLPDLLARVRPRSRWFFPAGPAAQLAPVLERLHFKPLNAGDAVASCMGLAEMVRAARLLHTGDPLLTDHVLQAKKWPVGDGWRFIRKGAGHVDAAYAAAAAAQKAAHRPPARRATFV